MNRNLQILEYDKIIAQLQNFCISDIGKTQIRNLKPSYSFATIELLQKETQEAKFCYDFTGKEPFTQLIDISSIIKKLKISGIITIQDALTLVTIVNSSQMTISYMNSNKLIREKANTLFSLSDNIEDISFVAKRIKEVISEDGIIKNTASIELKRIREKINNKQNEIKGKINHLLTSSLRNYMQETIVTMRNERYVFPIKATYRSKIDGIIQDQSSSGSTLYIEPMSLVNLQNSLVQLEYDEKREIEKILKELSLELVPFSETLQNNLSILVHFDVVFAKAKYAIFLNARAPKFTNEQIIVLNQAKHPLLNSKTVVANDLHLDKNVKALIIT